MLNFLFKKERQIELLLYEYLDTFKLSQESFSKAINSCILSDTNCEDFDFYIKQTHKHENKTSDISDEINNIMYGKALIPDSRGDIMELLNEIDIIPRLFKDILYMIQTQRMSVPVFLVPEIKELIKISMECCELLIRQTVSLFTNTAGIRALLGNIDTNESHCDNIERRITAVIFDSEIDPFQKIQLKELVEKIGNISDSAESVSKLVNIMSLKRRV
jgi:predicted phosphate transport protein (TIGR00153 family)